MCLSIKVEHPEVVLAVGVHAGHEFVVVHNRIGYRCGYVKVELGHPWHGKDYDGIDAEVHGGVTFAEHDKPCDKGGADTGYWVGFDCAHSGDACDPSLPGCRESRLDHVGYEKVRDTEYVIAECERLCEQAAAAK